MSPNSPNSTRNGEHSKSPSRNGVSVPGQMAVLGGIVKIFSVPGQMCFDQRKCSVGTTRNDPERPGTVPGAEAMKMTRNDPERGPIGPFWVVPSRIDGVQTATRERNYNG